MPMMRRGTALSRKTSTSKLLEHTIKAALKFREANAQAAEVTGLRHTPTSRVLAVQTTLKNALKKLPNDVMEAVVSCVKSYAHAPMPTDNATRLDWLIRSAYLLDCLEKVARFHLDDLR